MQRRKQVNAQDLYYNKQFEIEVVHVESNYKNESNKDIWQINEKGKVSRFNTNDGDNSDVKLFKYRPFKFEELNQVKRTRKSGEGINAIQSCKYKWSQAIYI